MVAHGNTCFKESRCDCSGRNEPFSGIDPITVFEVQKIIRRLKDRGLGILITDHNARETLKLVGRAYLYGLMAGGEAGVLGEDQAGPFAALAKLKRQD